MLTECSAEKKGMHTGTHTWIQGKDKKKKKKRRGFCLEQGEGFSNRRDPVPYPRAQYRVGA